MSEETTRSELSTVSENREAAVEVATAARRELAVFTRELEPQVYDNPEFVEAVKALALSGRKARVRILLVDSTRATREVNRLVELSRRVPSFIEIRKPHEDYQDIVETFIIADERAILYRKLATRWEGYADSNEPLRARDKLKLFNEIWQRSHADPETRRLRI